MAGQHSAYKHPYIKGKDAYVRREHVVGGRSPALCHPNIGDDVPAKFRCKKVHCLTVGDLIFRDQRSPGLGRLTVDSELDASLEKMPPSMVDSQLLRAVQVDMYSFEVGT